MKRKLTSGLFVIAVSLAATSTFYSCKDYDEDRNVEMQEQYTSLQKSLTSKIEELQTKINAIKSCDCDPNQISTLRSEFNNLLAGYAKFADLEGYAKTTDLDSYATLAKLDDYLMITDLDKKLGELGYEKGSADLSAYLKTADLDGLIDAYGFITDDALNNYYTKDEITTLLDKIKCDCNGNVVVDDQLAKTLNIQINGEGGLAEQVAKLNTQISTIQSQITNIQKVLSEMVTGIIVQGTYNPVLGTGSLPLDVQTNIVAAYASTFAVSGSFPAAVEADNNVIDGEGLNAWEAGNLGYKSISLKAEDVVVSGDGKEGNAGKVYLTVNPSTVDFTGKIVSLVTSQDNASPIKLSSLQKSDEELSFGYTRAAANGFYEANATLKSADVNAAMLDVTKMKSLAKSVYNDFKAKQSVDWSNVAGTIYNELSSEDVKAYGIKAQYTSMDVQGKSQTSSVYSDYKIAAFSIPCLSYNLVDKINGKLGKLPVDLTLDLSDLGLDDLKISEVDYPGSLTLTDIKATVEVTVQGKPGSEVNIPEYNPDGSVHKENGKVVYQTITLDGSGTGTADVPMADIQASLDKYAGEAKTAITDMVNDVNSKLTNVSGNASKYIDKVNNYLSKLNSLDSRLNSLLNNAGNILNPVMLYSTGDGYQVPSVIRGAATPIKKTVADGGIMLYPTSYSAELLAPAYKKYVAVANVYTSDWSESAQSGNAACLTALRKANENGGGINEVIDGSQYYVPFSGDAGYIYEIVYSAVDYNGYVRTLRYYFKITE